MRRRLAARGDDSGFTLMETIVSITLLGILMTASTAFFITANRSTSDLRHKQAATQLADDALEQANSLDARQLVIGRDQTSEHAQWLAANAAASATNPWSAVGAWLANTTEVWDSTTTTSGANCVDSNQAGGSQPLCIPTVPVSSVLDGITYQVNTYIGQCWKSVSTADNSCTNSSSGIQFYRVVAAVSWQGKSCPLGGCIFIASDLQNATLSDPVFNVNQVAAPTPTPIIVNPGPQSSTVSTNAYLQLNGSGGSGTYTWSATGLPPGLTLSTNTNSNTITGQFTSTGTSTVTLKMIDSANNTTTTSFTWTVNAKPTITAPTAAQASMTVGQADSLTFTGAAGTTPYTWTVSGALPPGLTYANGVISGTPTTAGSYPITETLTDKSNYTVSAAVTITVSAPPSLTTPNAQSSVTNTAISPLTIGESGGAAPLSWTLSGVPGLSINSSGVISGSATSAGAQTAVVTVTDLNGASSSISFGWTVTAPLSTTSPGNLVSGPTDSVLLTLQSAGGTAPVTWTATGLPKGLAVNGSTITGTPSLSAAGASPSTGTAYSVTITATDAKGATSSKTFTWTIKLRSGVITSGVGSYCANDSGSKTPPASTLIISYACGNSTNQLWTFQADKTIQIGITGGSYCMAATSTTAGSTLSLANCDATSPAQQWTPTANGSVVNLVNQGMCLALMGNPGNSSLTMQTCSTDSRLSWTLPS